MKFVCWSYIKVEFSAFKTRGHIRTYQSIIRDIFIYWPKKPLGCCLSQQSLSISGFLMLYDGPASRVEKILEGSRRPQKSTKKSSIRDRFFRYGQLFHFEFWRWVFGIPWAKCRPHDGKKKITRFVTISWVSNDPTCRISLILVNRSYACAWSWQIALSEWKKTTFKLERQYLHFFLWQRVC